MRTIANLLVCIVTAFAAWEPLTHLLADTPLPKPERKEVRSANGRLYAAMDPKRNSCRLGRCVRRERSWRPYAAYWRTTKVCARMAGHGRMW